MTGTRGRPLRVVQVSFHADVKKRDADALLHAWPTLVGVAAGVARAGVDVTVLQTAHEDATIRRDLVEYEFVNDHRRARRRLIARVACRQADVVHVHGFHHMLAVRQLTRSLGGVPVLLQDHGGVPPEGFRASAWRWSLRGLRGASFTARDQVAPWIRRGVLGPDLPIFEIHEGSSGFTIGDRDAARNATGMYGDPCLLWTSRLDPNKDPLTMLTALELAAKRLPQAHLWCCFGQAPLLDVVACRIAQSQLLRERVTMLGPRPHAEMEHRYRAADFYLQTSHHEGSGFSLIEALACGATPVVTDIPPSRRIVGDAGSLTPVGDPHAMAEALVAWAARDRTSLRRAARNRFDATLTFDRIGQELRAAYETLVQSCAS